MESSSLVRELSLGQTPREGQLQAINLAADPSRKQLNIKLPTGYGKTFTAYAIYNLLKKQGRVNRLLFIVPTDAQLNQLVTKCGDDPDTGKPGDYRTAGLHGLKQVQDLRIFGATARKNHLNGTHEVFATTPQSMCAKKGEVPAGGELVADLLGRGDWMIVVDEYHHYGIDKAWSRSLVGLPRAFLLAMSATPNRPGDDSAFGAPDFSVTYESAVEECAVKPLRGHSYSYRIDAIGEDGEIVSYTTSELAAEAGGDDPDKIEKLRIDRKLRWSPKYISPLVSVPLERLISDRLNTGRHLRAIVGAMCVSHAEMVCKQIAAMFPELQVDWVGTGLDGRPQEVNRNILKRLLEDERHENALDVLVHVGMAGEGLDSRYVSEVVLLNRASLNNTKNQEIGRGARYLEDAEGRPIVCNVNFDSGSDYAKYTGANLELAMDKMPPSDDEPDPDREPGEPRQLPEEPLIFIQHVELENIDSGSPEIVRMKLSLKKAAETRGCELPADWIKSEEATTEAIRNYRMMRAQEAEAFNEVSTLAQWNEAVNMANSHVTGVVLRALHNGYSIEKGAAGDIKKRINTMKRRAVGAVDNTSVENLRKHWNWLRNLEQIILTKGVPAWLA